jgi:hypothetical protein
MREPPMPQQSHDLYDQAAQQTVELANRLADQDREADPWEVADGKIQFTSEPADFIIPRSASL